MYFGISQYRHGHEYLAVYTRGQIKAEQPDLLPEKVEPGYQDSVDCYWPYGGSNSSATFITYFGSGDEGEKAAVQFLTKEPEGPDLADPTLMDLAEYSQSIDVDLGVTDTLVKRFGIDLKDKADARYTELIERGMPEAVFYDREYRDLRLYENGAQIKELLGEPAEGSKEEVKAIVEKLKSLRLTANQCSEIFAALEDQKAVIAGKFWTIQDIVSVASFPLSIHTATKIAEQEADRFDYLSECHDEEWNILRDALKQTGSRS